MQRRHRRAHAMIWTGLGVVVPILLAIIFASTPKLSPDAPAVRLDVDGTHGGQP